MKQIDVSNLVGGIKGILLYIRMSSCVNKLQVSKKLLLYTLVTIISNRLFKIISFANSLVVKFI